MIINITEKMPNSFYIEIFLPYFDGRFITVKLDMLDYATVTIAGDVKRSQIWQDGYVCDVIMSLTS